jgi:hypothetical protein
MSSHREAAEISKDPVCDNTDTYAFISPDKPDTVTILTNYIPLEAAAAGPNFYEFGNDVLYSIHIANSRSGHPDITYEFRFTTEVRDESTFLYNTGAIASLDDSTWNRRQFYTVTKVTGREHTGTTITKPGKSEVIARDLPCPPCNIGPHSTPDYPPLAQAAVHSLSRGVIVFAGQRNDGFFADLGAIFDLGDLRPFQNLHSGPIAAASGVDTLRSGINVHTIAMQIPITELTHKGIRPTNVDSKYATIGVWGAASRRKMRVMADQDQSTAESGPWVQVSRLGNPLFNELLVGQGAKDRWNRSAPSGDKVFASGVAHPELARLLNVLYPGVFPNLAKLAASNTTRADLEAVLLTGIPAGVVPGFQNNTGKIQSDMLRLNVAIPPTASPNALGLLGGDPQGYPNGRRVTDDVVTISLRAVAGVTYALVDNGFTPDAAANKVTQGVATPPTGAPGTARFIPYFPYLGIPDDGFDTPTTPTPPAAASAPTATSAPAPSGLLGLARR